MSVAWLAVAIDARIAVVLNALRSMAAPPWCCGDDRLLGRSSLFSDHDPFEWKTVIHSFRITLLEQNRFRLNRFLL